MIGRLGGACLPVWLPGWSISAAVINGYGLGMPFTLSCPFLPLPSIRHGKWGDKWEGVFTQHLSVLKSHLLLTLPQDHAFRGQRLKNMTGTARPHQAAGWASLARDILIKASRSSISHQTVPGICKDRERTMHPLVFN